MRTSSVLFTLAGWLGIGLWLILNNSTYATAGGICCLIGLMLSLLVSPKSTIDHSEIPE
jgi:hypothetical protein